MYMCVHFSTLLVQQNFCQDRSLCHSRSPIVSSSVRCPKLEIAVLPYIDDRCNVGKKPADSLFEFVAQFNLG